MLYDLSSDTSSKLEHIDLMINVQYARYLKHKIISF